MKIKKTTLKKDRKILGIRQPRVDLFRLSPKTISRYLSGGKSEPTNHFHYLIKMSRNKWAWTERAGENSEATSNCENYTYSFKFSRDKCVAREHTGPVSPVIKRDGAIMISFRHQVQTINEENRETADEEKEVKSRRRIPIAKNDVKKSAQPPIMTISELSVASQKRNLWEKCKKLDRPRSSGILALNILLALLNGKKSFRWMRNQRTQSAP